MTTYYTISVVKETARLLIASDMHKSFLLFKCCHRRRNMSSFHSKIGLQRMRRKKIFQLCVPVSTWFHQQSYETSIRMQQVHSVVPVVIPTNTITSILRMQLPNSGALVRCHVMGAARRFWQYAQVFYEVKIVLKIFTYYSGSKLLFDTQYELNSFQLRIHRISCLSEGTFIVNEKTNRYESKRGKLIKT